MRKELLLDREVASVICFRLRQVAAISAGVSQRAEIVSKSEGARCKPFRNGQRPQEILFRFVDIILRESDASQIEKNGGDGHGFGARLAPLLQRLLVADFGACRIAPSSQ